MVDMVKKILIIHNRPIELFVEHERFFLDRNEYEIHIITNDRDGMRNVLHQVEMIHYMYYMDTSFVESMSKYIIKRFKIEILFTISEKFIDLVARLRSEFNLEGDKIENILPFRNKIIMKKVVQHYNIKVPKFLEIEKNKVYDEEIQNFGKVVIKPVDGYGSQDVFFANDQQEIRKIVDKTNDLDVQFEIEEYIEGEMYHCDSIIVNNIVTFFSVAQYLPNPGEFSKIDIRGSIIITDSKFRRIVEDFNQRVICAMGLQRGVTHLEFFISPKNEIIFCEIAARPAGGGLAKMIELFYGVNLFKEALLLQADSSYLMPLTFESKDYKGVAKVSLLRKAGTVEKINPLQHPSLIFAQYNCYLGEKIKNSYHCADYIAEFYISLDSKIEFLSFVDHVKNNYPILYKVEVDV